MRSLSFLLASSAVLALAACSRPASGVPTAAPAPSGSGREQSPRAEISPLDAAERLLVRRARLDMEVDDPVAFAGRVEATIRRFGGFVAQSTRRSDVGRGRGSAELVLRVPAASLDDALDSLGALGKVRSRSSSADDVTEEVVDLEARAANLRASRDRLRALQERTTSVADVVAVERELARVQGELDSLEARLEYLRRSVALAEVTVSAHPRVRLGPLGIVIGGAARLVAALFVLP